MSTFYLVNKIRYGTRTLQPGALIDSAQDDTAGIAANGGFLIPSSDATIASAAAIAQALSLRGQWQEAAFVMMAAATKSAAGDDLLANLASNSSGKGSDLVKDVTSNTTLTLALAAVKAKADAAPAFQVVAAGAMVSGTLTINTGITIATASEVIPILRGAVTGSTNFACLRELVSSRVNGAPNTGTVVIEAVGNDGAKDADAAVASGLIHVVILTAQ